MTPPAGRDTSALARRTGRRLRLTGSVANTAGAVLVFVLLAVVDAGAAFEGQRPLELVGLFVVVMLGGLTGASILLTRQAAPVIDALDAGLPIAGRARQALFRMPAANAAVSGAMWVVAGAVFGTYVALRFDEATAADAAQVASIIVLGGLSTGGVVYLVLERALQPVFALAFQDEEPTRIPGLALGPKLVLAWLLGSGAPLLIIALVALAVGTDRTETRLRVLPWVGVGLVVGLGLTIRAARSVAEPLAGLRRAMGSVRDGDFAARAPVDDATEVGLLQAGFNEMVAGLEERERLRDLFGRHVGPDVARHALERGVSLGGEQVEASALFVDLVGSTALASERPAAEVVELLNALFAAVAHAVDAHGGWVNKFEGDAALCVFGPPTGDADHATCALRAARDLRSSIDGLRERFPVVDVGIGVSSGAVVAGNVGSEHRYEYTVIGDPVNEAARVTEVAKEHPTRLLAAGTSVETATPDEAARWRRTRTEHLRGRGRPTELWEPVES